MDDIDNTGADLEGLIVERTLGTRAGRKYLNEAAVSDGLSGGAVQQQKPMAAPKRFPGEFPGPPELSSRELLEQHASLTGNEAISDSEKLHTYLKKDWIANYSAGLAARLDRFGEFFGLESRVMSYRINPVQSLVFGSLGIALFVISILIPFWPQVSRLLQDGYEGGTRLALMFAGAFLIFMGWPRYVRKIDSVEENDAELDQLARVRRDFHRRLRR
jgi:hypothetical protein